MFQTLFTVDSEIYSDISAKDPNIITVNIVINCDIGSNVSDIVTVDEAM